MIPNRRLLSRVLLAGLAGGAAEMAWAALYASASDVSGIEIARQVGASVFPAAADLPAAPTLGIAVHLLLSIALAFAFAGLLRSPIARELGRVGAMCAAVAFLATVWLFNFFVLLPALNLAFVTLMPYGVTLFSKLLFGVAMASVLGAAPLAPQRSSKLQFSGGRP